MAAPGGGFGPSRTEPVSREEASMHISSVAPTQRVGVDMMCCTAPLQLVDEEFDVLEAFFCFLESGILKLLENVETFLHHLQVGGRWQDASKESVYVCVSVTVKPIKEQHGKCL